MPRVAVVQVEPSYMDPVAGLARIEELTAEGRTLFRVFPHNILYPGIFLAFTVLAINIMGDGLRDTLDPKMSKKV